MFEMSHTCKYHRNAVTVCCFNGFLIPYRTSRLNNGSNTRFMCSFHTIREREKRIGSHDTAIIQPGGSVRDQE